MSSPSFQRLALIGCGLMGGSFALALRQAGLVAEVVGFSASESTRERAVQLQVIDRACTSVADAVQGADLVLLAVPVGATQACFEAMQPALSADCLLMDVGSTKGDVVMAAQATLKDRLSCLVPAHPITGKEVAGVAHADARLYQGCHTILTPLPDTPAGRLHTAQALWTAIGSQVSVMDTATHDATFAAVSHLPHLLAFAAVNALTAQPQGAAYLSMAGPGFRDFSRIAASAPSVWRDILSVNRTEVLTQLSHFRAALEQFEQVLQSGDAQALEQLIQRASAVRAAWSLPAHTSSHSRSES